MWQYYLMVGLGLVLLFFAFLTFRNVLLFLKKAEKTTATVIRLRIIESDGEVYSPIFRFRTWDENEYEYELAEASNPASWSVGETETIIYDPADPTKAQLYTYFRVFAWPLILLSIALPLLVVGLGFFIAELYLK
ncbi:DUF3592 domain-containing protein [Sphingobacterium ginsenosidimutans]